MPIDHSIIEPGKTGTVMPDDVVDAGTLFRSHMPFVANFIARIGAPKEDVDDLVQDVFLIAHRCGGFRPGPAKATTWLAEIAMRVVSGRVRSRRRHAARTVDEVPGDLAAREPDPARRAETAQQLRAVQEALQTLDLARRAVFVLFEIEGESCGDIAAGLKIPINTVYTRLHAARRDFVKAMSRQQAADRHGAEVALSRARV